MLGARNRRVIVLVACLGASVACYALGAVSTAGVGLVGQYYSNPDFVGAPFLTTVDRLPSTELIAQRWGLRPPPAFSVVWSGYVTVDRAGVYEFATTSDDGSRLFVDQQMVVDNSGNHGPVEESGRIELRPGSHPIRLEYREAGGGYLLSWTWNACGAGHRPMPAWRLSREEVKPAVAIGARALRLASLPFFVFAVVAALWTFSGHSRRLVDVAAVAATIISALPIQPVVRTNYYEYQVHLGFVERLRWGIDLACTYGPWGFVGVPLFHPSTFAWM